MHTKGTDSSSLTRLGPVLKLTKTMTTQRVKLNKSSSPQTSVMNIIYTDNNHYCIGQDIEKESNEYVRVMDRAEVVGDGRCCFVAFLRQLEV